MRAAVKALPDAQLVAAGFNLAGCLPAERYDALVPRAFATPTLLPAARSVVVLACGGRALFDAFRTSPEAGLGRDPLDAYTRRVVGEAAERLAPETLAVFAFEQRGGRFADFVALGRAAGLGGPSRLGLLLHPSYGPWMSIRAAVLAPLSLPASAVLADFGPCSDCPAPCQTACPGAAVSARGFAAAACARTRAAVPGCRSRCDARRACVVGPEHAYAAEAEAHHMASVPY